MKQVLYSFAALLVPFVAWGTYLTVQQNAFIHSLSEENASFGKMGSELSHLLITVAFLTGMFTRLFHTTTFIDHCTFQPYK